MQHNNLSTTCVKTICLMLVLLFTQARAAAQDDSRVTPYVFLSCTAYGESTEHPAFLNDNKFAEPQVIVYESEDGAAISNRFYITYSIQGGTYHAATSAKEKSHWEDPVTGTTITSLYGDVETGPRPGKVTIVATATPTARYESLFNASKGTYTITLTKETPTVVLSLADDWKATAGSTIALPSFTVTYQKATGEHADQTVTRDITNLYSLTATDITPVAGTETSPITITGGKIIASTLSSTTDSRTATVRFSLTPKEGYEQSFEAIADIDRTLTITRTEKIKPVLVFPEGGDKAYWGTQGRKLLRPTVLDQWGNDISAQVSETGGDSPLWISWSVAPLAEGKTMHTPNTGWYNAVMQEQGEQPLDDTLYREYGPQLWGLDNWNVGGAAYIKGTTRNPSRPYDEYQIASTAKRTDYSYKVYCQVYPKPYHGWAGETDYSAIYDATESSYDMNVLARKTRLVITPNPSTYDIGLNSKLSFVHRFRIRSVFTPEVDDPNGSGLTAGTPLYFVYGNDPDYKSSAKNVSLMTYSLKYLTGIAKMNNFPQETQHYILNADGTFASERVDGVTYELYMVGSGWDDNSASEWTIQFLKATDNPVEFGVYPYNDIYDSPDEIAYARVSEQTKPIVTVGPSPFVIYTTDTELPSQPEISITDAAGDDIRSFTYINTKNEEVQGEYTITVADSEGKMPAGLTYSDGKFSIDTTLLQEGGYALTVSATVDSEVKTFADGAATLRVIVKKPAVTKPRVKWDVVNKQTNSATEYTDYADSEHGKLVFTEGGILTAGYSIDAVPGLTVQFGSYDEQLDDAANTWEARSSTATEDNGKVIVYGDPVTLDNDTHLPTGGTYYILYPRANGFLTVDAKYAENNNIVITSADLSEQEIYLPKTDEKGEHQFRYPLFAGTTYYLYNKGAATETGTYTSEPLRLHGLNFTPAFIRQRSDAAPQTRATAYAGSYSNDLPMLTQRGTTVDQQLITFGAGGVGRSATQTVDATDYVTVSQTSGTVTPQSLGTAGVFGAGTIQPTTKHKAIATEADRVNIHAVVSSAWNSNIVTVPYYNLLIDQVPTYMVKNLYMPVVGEETQTSNYLTHLTAFFGGWERAANRPYYDTKGNQLVDSWKTARMDSVGADGRTLDAFAYCSFGSQNAKPENINLTYKYDAANEDLTYQVPCRGTYMRYEPKENGLLAVYIIQNGMVAYDGNKENASKSGNDKVKVNPVFITDETGAPVPLTKWEGGDQDKARAEASGSFTQGLIRCSYQDILDDCTTTGALNSSSEKDAISVLKAVGYIPEEAGGEPAADVTKGSQQTVYDVAQTLDASATAGSKGYAVISKAYVRYAFRVKAGKTYFVFMNGSKLGNGGFAFMPDDWTATRTEPDVETVCLDEQGTATGSLDEFLDANSRKVEADKTYNVKLYHKFVAGRWNSICLPFSVSQSEFKRVFGNDAAIIGYDSIAHNEEVDGTIYSNVIRFTQHSYHWMVAGRPYFILPGKNFEALKDEVNDRLYVQFDSVTFEQTSDAFTPARTLKADSTFCFRGFYEPTTISAGDYYIGSATDGTAKLSQATRSQNLLGYRAVIGRQAGSNAKLGTFIISDLDDEGASQPTGIYDVYTDSWADETATTPQRGVFSLQGQRLGNGVADLRHLPAGVYIVNGMKTVKR